MKVSITTTTATYVDLSTTTSTTQSVNDPTTTTTDADRLGASDASNTIEHQANVASLDDCINLCESTSSYVAVDYCRNCQLAMKYSLVNAT